MSVADATRGRRLDWLSILAFVLASLWLLGVGSVLALYVGRRSLRRTKVDRDLRGRTVAWSVIAVAIFGVAMSALWIGVAVAA